MYYCVHNFIISLALALGLSKMSSNKVEVNSLFLDDIEMMNL